MAWSPERKAQGGYLHPKKVQRILVQHQGICHLCGHPEAGEVDHVIPWAEWTDATLSVHDPSNLRPAHGTPCPTCERDCHADKTKAEAARGRARGLQQRKSRAKRPAERHPGTLD